MKQIILFFAEVIIISAILNTALMAGSTKVLRIKVKGMVCDFCAQGLIKNFKAQSEVNSVEASLENHTLTVILKPNSEMSTGRVNDIVENSGFSVEAIDSESATIEKKN